MKRITAVVISIFAVWLQLVPISAASNEFHKLSMEVAVQSDGAAVITETWNMSLVEGTELYKAYGRMGDADITDFSVSNELAAFETMDSWDVDASREEKAFKSGVIQNDDSYELCFGIGDYGNHVYVMEYRINNFVDQYADGQAINYQFVAEEMSPKPQEITVRITGPEAFTKDNAQIYAFGFIGNIHFQEDGSILATNVKENGELGELERVNIFVGMPNASYPNTNHTYDDVTYQEMVSDAKEGSSYRDNSQGDMNISSGEFGLIVGGSFAFVLVLIFIIARYSKMQKDRFPKSIVFEGQTEPLLKKTDVPPFRDVPVKGDIYRFYTIAKIAALDDETKLKSGLVSAVLLTWIRKGFIEFVKVKGTILNRKKYEVDFNKEIICESETEEEMLTFFREAAGENILLEAKEFEKWCTKNHDRMEAWFTKVEIDEKRKLREEGYITNQYKENKFLGFTASKDVMYSEGFRELLYQVTGFKNFLLEFSSIEDKEVREVHLWESYLILASILGLAENVEKELGRLYPEFEQYSHLDPTFTMLYTRMFIYNSMTNSYRSHAASGFGSSGGGGFSSFGGGGGGFHGGGGGGVR